VTKDLENFGFNTAVAAMMELTNSFYKYKIPLPFGASQEFWRQQLLKFLQLLAPFAPHLAEELWHVLGQDKTIHLSAWPAWDEELTKSDLITIVIQVNGRVRGELETANDSDMEELIPTAKAQPNVAAHLKN